MVDVDLKVFYGRTPLFGAASERHEGVVKLLLEKRKASQRDEH
jgi:ankyrin repeat protein